jgi:transcriptional regulator with XRE-family HTH domain
MKADQVDKSVGSRLKQMRERKGFTLAQAGKLIGVSYAQIYKYEDGENRCGWAHLRKFAKAYGVSVGWFFNGALK